MQELVYYVHTYYIPKYHIENKAEQTPVNFIQQHFLVEK